MSRADSTLGRPAVDASFSNQTVVGILSVGTLSAGTLNVGKIQITAPAGVLNNSVARFDSTGVLQDSLVTVTDGGSMSILGSLDTAELITSQIAPVISGGTISVDGSVDANAFVGEEFQLQEPGVGTDTIRFRAPGTLAVGGYTLTWPTTDGMPGQSLQTDGTGTLDWVTPPGGGDVVGPAGATDHALARFDTNTGKLIQNSGVLLSDTNDVTGVVNITSTGTVQGATLTDGTLSVNAGSVTSAVNITASGTIQGANITATSTLRTNNSLVLEDPGAPTNTLTQQAAAGTATYSITWPGAQATGTQVLSNTGGTLSWVNATDGPGSSTDDAIARFDGNDGKLLQNSTAILSDAGSLRLGGTGPQLGLGEPSGSGTQTIFIEAPALAADYTLTMPNAQGGADQVLTNDSAGALSWKDGVPTPADPGDDNADLRSESGVFAWRVKPYGGYLQMTLGSSTTIAFPVLNQWVNVTTPTLAMVAQGGVTHTSPCQISVPNTAIAFTYLIQYGLTYLRTSGTGERIYDVGINDGTGTPTGPRISVSRFESQGSGDLKTVDARTLYNTSTATTFTLQVRVIDNISTADIEVHSLSLIIHAL